MKKEKSFSAEAIFSPRFSGGNKRGGSFFRTLISQITPEQKRHENRAFFYLEIIVPPAVAGLLNRDAKKNKKIQ